MAGYCRVSLAGLAEWDIDTVTLDPESDGDLDILCATITAGTRRRMGAACERDRQRSGQRSYVELSTTVTRGQAELPSSRTVKQHGHGTPHSSLGLCSVRWRQRGIRG